MAKSLGRGDFWRSLVGLDDTRVVVDRGEEGSGEETNAPQSEKVEAWKCSRWVSVDTCLEEVGIGAYAQHLVVKLDRDALVVHDSMYAEEAEVLEAHNEAEEESFDKNDYDDMVATCNEDRLQVDNDGYLGNASTTHLLTAKLDGLGESGGIREIVVLLAGGSMDVMVVWKREEGQCRPATVASLVLPWLQLWMNSPLGWTYSFCAPS